MFIAFQCEEWTDDLSACKNISYHKPTHTCGMLAWSFVTHQNCTSVMPSAVLKCYDYLSLCSTECQHKKKKHHQQWWGYFHSEGISKRLIGLECIDCLLWAFVPYPRKLSPAFLQALLSFCRMCSDSRLGAEVSFTSSLKSKATIETTLSL